MSHFGHESLKKKKKKPATRTDVRNKDLEHRASSLKKLARIQADLYALIN